MPFVRFIYPPSVCGVTRQAPGHKPYFAEIPPKLSQIRPVLFQIPQIFTFTTRTVIAED
jgi:hypothetical protein